MKVRFHEALVGVDAYCIHFRHHLQSLLLLLLSLYSTPPKESNAHVQHVLGRSIGRRLIQRHEHILAQRRTFRQQLQVRRSRPQNPINLKNMGNKCTTDSGAGGFMCCAS